MRRLAIGVLALALMGAWGGTALAQFEQPIGDIYLSFDNTALPDKGVDGRYKTQAAFVPFNFYVMFHVDFGEAPYNDAARNLTDGCTAWEAAFSVPAAITVTSRALPSGHTNFAANDDFIVGTGGQCVTGSSTPFVLVTYSALLLAAANDIEVGILPATPSSFVPQTPGFLGCPADSGRLVPVKPGRWQAHWIKVNCTTAPCGELADEQQTWGSLKSSFSN